MSIEIDDADPCGAAAALRAAYLRLISGQAVQQVRFRAGPNGVERFVSYGPGDPSRLLAAVREYEARCAAMQGRPPRRAIFSGGGR